MLTRRNFIKGLVVGTEVLSQIKPVFGSDFLTQEGIEFARTFKPIRRISLIGIGGAGTRAIAHLIRASLGGVDFIAVDRDFSSLVGSLAPTQIPLSPKTMRGPGLEAGMDSVRKALIAQKGKFKKLLEGSDLVFVIAGLGGEIGTGGGPILAQMSREAGALTFLVVTTPFPWEGEVRLNQANYGLDCLSQSTYSVILIPNEDLIPQATPIMNQRDLFLESSTYLSNSVKGLCDLVLASEVFSQDYAELWKLKGKIGRVGFGWGKGAKRSSQAIEIALTNSFRDNLPVTKAINIIINITVTDGISLEESIEFKTPMNDYLVGNEDSNLIWGVVPGKLSSDEMRIILYGFQDCGKGVTRLAA